MKLTSNKSRITFALAVILAAFAGIIDPISATAAGMMLSFETVAGSTIAVSVGVPATYDTAGYGALSYSAVGEITGEVLAKYSVQ